MYIYTHMHIERHGMCHRSRKETGHIITVSIISITMKELNRTRSRCCDFCRWEDTTSSVIVAVGMVSTDEDVFFFVRCSIVCIITVRFFFSFGGSSIVYARISLHSFVISFVRSFVRYFVCPRPRRRRLLRFSRFAFLLFSFI